MNAFATTQPAGPIARNGAMSLERLLFICTVLLAGGLFWIGPRLPMGDLPQHAAQVSLLRDLLTGTSPWRDLVHINYFTPYLLGYGLALALSFVMPVVAALKLLMMLAYYAFVAGGVLLRKRFDADERLDWLYVGCFFGMAFQFGFYTFLVAAPLAFFFLALARRYALAPTRAQAAGVFLAGVVLFFSHGLVFLFACAIGAAFVLASRKSLAHILSAWVPYMLLGAVALAYYFYVKQNGLVMSAGPASASQTAGIVWDWGGAWGWHRVYNFLLYSFATEMKDWYFLLAAMFMLAAPWLMGARPNWGDRAALMPMAAILLIWFLAPSDALKIDYLYQRFGLYLLPAYALMFRRPDMPRAAGPAATSVVKRTGAPRAVLTQAMLVLICWSFLGVVAVREHRFAVENASFETLLSATEPGQRALSLVYAPQSDIIHNLYTYHSYPLWYQADRKGFVDFNFAFFLPQVVRFRPDQVPAMRPELERSAETFDWHAVHGRIYRYFFVRHTGPLPAGMFNNDECRVVLIKEAGAWSLFERQACS